MLTAAVAAIAFDLDDVLVSRILAVIAAVTRISGCHAAARIVFTSIFVCHF